MAACSIASTRCCLPLRCSTIDGAVQRAGRMKRLAILGSTGSIGTSALAVVDAHPDRLRVVGAGRRRQRRPARRAGRALSSRASSRWRPPTAADRADSAACASNAARRSSAGAEGLVAVATHPDVDIVLCASSGTAGARGGARRHRARARPIALANKEVLVMAGALVTEAARRRGVAILPVDSEHNAIHQCLHGRDRGEIQAADPHRVGRTVPRCLRRRARRRSAADGAAAPDVADGTQDHDRFGDADEQRPRGDRGALAVRRVAPIRSTW